MSEKWEADEHWVISNLNINCCSVSKSCLTLRDSVNCSTPGLPVPHHLLELAQTHVR